MMRISKPLGGLVLGLSLLTGCSSTPEMNKAPFLEFSEQQKCFGYQKESVALSADGRTLQSVGWTPRGAQLRSSGDGGKTWGNAASYEFKLAAPHYVDYRWHSLVFQGKTAWVNTATDRRLTMIVADGQGSDCHGEILDIKVPEGLSKVAGGVNNLICLEKVEGLEARGVLSSDQGASWREWRGRVSLPSNWNDWTLKPTFNSPYSQQLAIDAKDRIHLYLEEVRLTKEDEKKAGALHLCFSSEGKFEWSEFLPDSGEVFAADFARNHSRLNEFYRVTSRRYIDQDSVKEMARYQVYLSVSTDSGEHWQTPYMLSDHPGAIHDLQLDATDDFIVCSWSARRSRRSIDFFCCSRDGGKSWSTPQEIDFKRPDEKAVLVSKDGVCVIYQNRHAKGNKKRRLYTVYSGKGQR